MTVAGRRLSSSFSFLEQRGLKIIEDLQDGQFPVDLRGFIEDSVRLARECADKGIGSISGAGWQDIATAPKDKIVLVTRSKDDHPTTAKLVQLAGRNPEWRTVPGFYRVNPNLWMPLPVDSSAEKSKEVRS